MKKLLVVLSALAVVLFASCGNKTVDYDEHGCFVKLDDAKADAQKNNKNILVIVTSEGDDITSDAFVQDVIKTESFETNVKSQYSVFHFDYSEKAFAKTVAADDATDEEVAAAEKAMNLMQDNYRFAITLGVEYTPEFFILSKEGYVITEVYYEDEDISLEAFENLLTEYVLEVNEFNEMVAATKTGKKDERLAAIDALFSSTPVNYRIFMKDLCEKALSLDKKNKSGLMSKYIFSKAENEAADLFGTGDVQGCIQKYVEASENPYIDAKDAQECLYMCAYILSSSGSTDIDAITKYLEDSYNLAPDTELAPYIQNTLYYYQNFDMNEAVDMGGEDSIDLSELLGSLEVEEAE